MSYRITQQDLALMRQESLRYSMRVDVRKGGELLARVEGVGTDGTIQIDAGSDIRRSCDITLVPNPYCGERISVGEDGLIWLNNTIELSIGLYDMREQRYQYYPMGTYVYTEASGSVGVSEESVTLRCQDMMAMLDGSKNGQVGALATVIPAYEEDPETGAPTRYNRIRDAVIQVLRQMCHIEDFAVDDMGEYKGMPDYNPRWEEYREENPLWDTVPYDLEFPCGCSLLSILQGLRDLYPNYEMFFDERNTFVCRMMPSAEGDEPALGSDFLSRILVSEDTTVDMASVRNICEVWGQSIDADYYTEDCASSGGTYSCQVEGYGAEYYNGDTVAVRLDSASVAGQRLDVNGIGPLEVYDEYLEEPIAAGAAEAGTVYVFKIRSRHVGGQDVMRAYLLGHWQAHGMSVLTDGTEGPDTYTSVAGKEMPKYGKEYFQTVYNCESVEMTAVPGSPFAVQRIGEILDVKTGDEYENITSDALAVNRAHYENWRNARLTDDITITTLLCPFLDVNEKVAYRPIGATEDREYVIRSVSHDFGGGTSTVNMYRFYPLYEDGGE